MKTMRSLVTIALLVAAPGVVRADSQKLATDGTVHRIDVEVWTSPQGKAQGTALRHVRQKPTGGRDSALVPGTDDAALDQEPAVEFEGSSGQIIVVWSRWDGTGFQLYGARFDRGAWSAPRPLARIDGDQRAPQIRLDDKYLHVVSRRDRDGATAYYRTSYPRGSFDLAFGPELLPPDGGPSSTSDATSDPSGFSGYFGAPLPGRVSGEPPHVVVWGVRDEPVPVGYFQLFDLPLDARNPSQVEAKWIHGRFTVWFVSGDRFYYATRRSVVWSEFRVIDLSATVGPSDAKRLVTDMLRSSP